MKKTIFWLITFSVVLMLAVVVIFASDTTNPSIWGLPSWLLYFFAIEVLFCVVYYLFTKTFWTTED
jgi:uncharacterized membrane protein